MKWLYKLEYKYGRHYIRRLMTIVVAGMAVVYFLNLAASGAGFSLINALTLNRAAILQGQVWRLITFIFIPPSQSPIWLLVGLYFYYMIGTSLENAWGGFRFNLYYLVGMLGAIIACFLVGSASNTYLNLSLFLAFATVAPDTTFLLLFILPVKAKWLGIAYGVFLVVQLLFTFLASPAAGLVALVSLAFSLANYFLFFGRSLFDVIQNQIRVYKNRRNWRGR